MMKKYSIKLMKSKFIKNIVVVASGTVLAQLIGLMLLPIVTRLYGPEAYGLLGTFTAITTILTPVAALTIPIAIVLPRKNSEAISIILLSLKVIGIIVCSSLIIIVLFHGEITKLLQAESVSKYMYLIPITILFSGLFNIMTQWLIRTGQYKIIANATVYQPIIVYGSMVLIGLIIPHASVLIIITVFKAGITALHMYISLNYKKDTTKIKLNEATIGSLETLKKYKDFPLYRAPESFISNFSHNIPILLLTSFFNPAAAGFYTIGRTAMGLPSQLIGKAFGDVFYPRIATAANNRESLVKLIVLSTLVLLGIGIIPFGAVILAGPNIFTLIFGEEWLKAGEYAQWIALMSLSIFISRPAVHTLPVIRSQRFHLIFTVITTIARLLALFYGLIILGNDLIAVAFYCLISSVLYILLVIFTLIKGSIFMKKEI